MMKKYKNTDELRIDLKEAFSRLGHWQLVAEEWERINGYKPNRGTCYAICEKKYEPKTVKLRAKLGLPVLCLAPICPEHGVVHIGRCPTRVMPKRLDSFTVKELRYMFENRREI